MIISGKNGRAKSNVKIVKCLFWMTYSCFSVIPELPRTASVMHTMTFESMQLVHIWSLISWMNVIHR